MNPLSPPSAVAESTKRCLILTLKAGSGHFRAAEAIEEKMQQLYASVTLYQADLLDDWSCGIGGRSLTQLWNHAQRKGNLWALGIFQLTMPVANWMIAAPVYLSALYMLAQLKIDHIIDTQNMGLWGVIKAIRTIYWWTGKKITYEKVLTDLPTEKTYNYFHSIRTLSAQDRDHIILTTSKPYLPPGESEASFWWKNCKLPLSQIRYAPFPLRPAFLQHQTLDKTRPLVLSLSIPGTKERRALKAGLRHLSFSIFFDQTSAEITLPPEIRVTLMILGGNPEESAILQYVQAFIEAKQDISKHNQNDALFVFCNTTPRKGPSLIESVTRLIETSNDFPSSLSIFPLGFQNADMLAPLMYRSDGVLTRSGGITSMELLTACSGKIWIHRATPSKWGGYLFSKLRTMDEGMPHWERGNADHLAHIKNAQLVTPDIFINECRQYFALAQN